MSSLRDGRTEGVGVAVGRMSWRGSSWVGTSFSSETVPSRGTGGSNSGDSILGEGREET